MTIRQFTIIPQVVRTAAPGDILIRTMLYNVSQLFPPRVLVDQDVRLPLLTNASFVGSPRVTVGADFDIVLPALTNSSSFVAPTVQESPADGFIRLPALTNSSSFVAPTVAVAPADELIRLPALTNSSSIVAPTVVRDASGTASISGTSTVMFAGRSTAASAASVTGTSTATFAGMSMAAAVASITGTSTVAAVVADDGDGTMSLISTLMASGSATLDWSALSGTSWKLMGRLLVPSIAGSTMWLRFGTGAGPTFATTLYRFGARFVSSTGSPGQTGAEALTHFEIAQTVNNVAPGCSFELAINTDNANWVEVIGQAISQHTDGHQYEWRFGGGWPTSAPLTGIRVMFDSGNITSGNASLYSIPV